MEKLNKSNFQKVFQKIESFEYKTPSVFIVLVMLSILFVALLVKMQSDPVKNIWYMEKRSPTGTTE